MVLPRIKKANRDFIDTDSFIARLSYEGGDKGFYDNMHSTRYLTEQTERSDDDFTISIGLSGGLDSTCMWEMVKDQDDVRCFYADAGQNYMGWELDFIENHLEIEPELLYCPELRRAKNDDSILLGRNATIILKIAQRMIERNEWGEIWVGNVLDETYPLYGDVSKRFFADLQHLISLKGWDIRIVNPLAGLYKSDLVNLFDSLTLRNTYSCYDETKTDPRPCGHCKACYKRWKAFAVNRVDLIDQYIDTSKDYFRKEIEASLNQDELYYERIKKEDKIASELL